MDDRHSGRGAQFGGSRFWPLVAVAIILILLLGYCSLRSGRTGKVEQKAPSAVTTPRPHRSFRPQAAESAATAAHEAGIFPDRRSAAPPTPGLINSAPDGGTTKTGGASSNASVSGAHAARVSQASGNDSQKQAPCGGPTTKHAPQPSSAGAVAAMMETGPTTMQEKSAMPVVESTPAPSAGNGPKEELLSVVINDQPQHQTDLFLCPGNAPNSPLYAKKSDIQSWRMQVPGQAAYNYEGEKFYALDDIPGVTYRIDESTQTLYITAPPGVFGNTIVDGFFGRSAEPQRTPWGGFFNYDFLGTYTQNNTNVNGLFEAGIFNNWGVGTSSFLEQNLGGSGSHLIRLDTAWRHDNPDNMTSLILGDSVTQGGMIGLDVRLGGIQYGTNFSTRPYFITFPMPGLNGQAALPSTVDLYVNGLLKSSQQVPSGPFSVPAVPVVTGPGSATLVVHDALGREQVITTSFYASSSLLKAGLDDYSFSAGKLRQNYGLDSYDYGNFAATGLFRHGFTSHFTGEVHGEFSGSLSDLSLGGTFVGSDTGVVNTALSVSNSDLGSGVLGQFGVQRQWQDFSLGANVKLASPDYTELGYNGMPAPRRQVTASAGANLGKHNGSLYATYLDQSSPLFGHTRLITAGYSVTLPGSGFLNLNAFHDLSGSGNNGVSLTFTMSFGERTTLIAGVTRNNQQENGYVQLQKALPTGAGYGYRVSTQVGPDPLSQAEFDYQNDVGTYRVGVSNLSGITSYQGEASGGLAFIGGSVYPSREINRAFGLVRVPGISGVKIYADNQPVATTNSNGDALIPNMRPYQNNNLRLGLKNLPIGAQVSTLKIDAVPRYRSGIVKAFPVTNTRGATFTVRVAGGKMLPAGAEVHIVGKSQTFPVGMDGEVYVTGLAEHNILEATWENQSCKLIVNMPKHTQDPLPDLGTFDCEGIHP